MANYSTNDQVTYVLQWFATWSEFQREDFVTILSQKLLPGQFINGLVNGLQNMDTTGRPPSLFAYQVKLFNEWWGTWNETDQERFKVGLKNTDGKFWSEVEAEMSGTRKTLDEDFYTVTVTTTPFTSSTSSSNTNNVRCVSSVEVAEEAKETTTIVISGNDDDEVKPTVMEVEDETANHQDEVNVATVVTVGES